MAKGKVEENSFELDDSVSLDTPVMVEKVESPIKLKKQKEEQEDTPIINCLRNERVIVRHIPKSSGMFDNPKHVLYGGMAENAVRVYVVPRLSSGMYVNVLTDSEKAFLEDIMGLENNALSIYRKVDNFWDDSRDNGISRVRLHKQDNFLNLADPEDYIRYKILLANKNFIAPSLQSLQDYPKASYEYVIISEGEETKSAKDSMSTTMKCYKEFGKIENDAYTLKTIIELIDGRPLAVNTKLEFLQAKINEIIQLNSKTFLKTVTDPYLSTKVLIKKAVDEGIIAKRGNFLYLRADNTPLCEHNEEPTLSIAAKYLNSPKHQDLLFTIQAKLQ